jgi:Fic family protein
MASLLDKRTSNRIENLKKELDRHQPLSSPVLKRLKEQFSIEMTYNSNAIEGNRMTLKETALVLREGITIKGRNLKEHLEAKNHEEALHFLFEIVDEKAKLTLSHLLIRQLHQLVVKDTEGESAGHYRKTDVRILGAKHQPPPGYEVQSQMTAFLNEIAKPRKGMSSIEAAAWIHHRFVAIHPFEDGNGRTGRLLMNLLLMRQGYPMAIILKNDRSKYYRALDQADRGNQKPIVQMIAQSVERSLNTYVKAISRSTPETELILLSKLASKEKISPKYLNLLVRKGLLQAQKEGRNWYTSHKAYRDYLNSRLRKHEKKTRKTG